VRGVSSLADTFAWAKGPHFRLQVGLQPPKRQTSPHGGPRIIVYGAYIWVKRVKEQRDSLALREFVYLLLTIVFVHSGAYNDANIKAQPCHKVAQPQEIARVFRR